MTRILLAILGAVLIAAALAKLGALQGPVDSLGWPRSMIVVGAAAELILGAWFLSGRGTRTAHGAALGLFILFSVLSAYQTIRGVPSCGCLGKLYVHPAWMLTFDAGVVLSLSALLVVERRRRTGIDVDLSGDARPPRPLWTFVGIGVAAIVLILATAGATVHASGSWRALAQWASNRNLVVSPSTTHLGAISVGEAKKASIHVANRTSRPLLIVGGKADCSCMVTTGLPLTVPAFADATVPVEVRALKAGLSEVQFQLFPESAAGSEIRGRVLYMGVDPEVN